MLDKRSLIQMYCNMMYGVWTWCTGYHKGTCLICDNEGWNSGVYAGPSASSFSPPTASYCGWASSIIPNKASPFVPHQLVWAIVLEKWIQDCFSALYQNCKQYKRILLISFLAKRRWCLRITTCREKKITCSWSKIKNFDS